MRVVIQRKEHVLAGKGFPASLCSPPDSDDLAIFFCAVGQAKVGDQDACIVRWG